jgi:hypothetical protein
VAALCPCCRHLRCGLARFRGILGSKDRTMQPPAETLVELPSPLHPLAQVRSTLLLSSVEALRARQLYDAYLRHLPAEEHERVVHTVAGIWVPVEAAVAHYAACDALGLTPEEQLSVGRVTGQGTREHLMRVAGMVARGLGVTPWTVLEQFPRFWGRMFDGGGIAVYKLGPKEADIVYAKCRLLASPYFRGALRGVALTLLEAAARRCLMTELRKTPSPHDARYRISWV